MTILIDKRIDQMYHIESVVVAQEVKQMHSVRAGQVQIPVWTWLGFFLFRIGAKKFFLGVWLFLQNVLERLKLVWKNKTEKRLGKANINKCRPILVQGLRRDF